jgi:D-alanyl-D-alanine carboxypeptidase
MTRRAHELGMNDTTFRNASGLPNRGQLSTARDMATLARAMIETFPHHYHFFSIDSFSFKDHVHKNHNNLLGNYEGADGIKTGYIRASGFNLVASVARNGTRLIGVVFGGKTARSRDVHMASLLNKSWDKATALSFAGAQPLPKPQAPFTETVALEPADAPANFELPEREGGWAIQIGAFSAFGTAHAAARSAASRLRNLPGNASIEITPYRSRGSVVYRARLTGFDELTARAQCRELRRQGNACALVTPGGTVQLAGLAN